MSSSTEEYLWVMAVTKQICKYMTEMRVPHFPGHLKAVLLPEMDLALSMAGTLGRDAGRLVEDVLSKCSEQREEKESHPYYRLQM